MNEMNEKDIQRIVSITRIMGSLPDQKKEVLLSFGAGMLAMTEFQNDQQQARPAV